MTELSSLPPHADAQLSSVVPLAPVPPAQLNGVSHSAVDDAPADDEESSTIKCICGYQDDDGHTVLCEKCNTWQHIRCYYPVEDVPDVHECADCLPRDLDRRKATEHQRQLRELSTGAPRKAKRPSQRTTKKKAPQQQPEVNGWSHDRHDLERDSKSGSPKAQPPPSKKAKTSHKASTSVASLKQPGAAPSSRKRANSTSHGAASPTKSPGTPFPNGYPTDYFSREYMNICNNHEYTTVAANLFNKLDVSNEMSTWLKNDDATREATKGKGREEIFKRLDRSMEALEATAPRIDKVVREDKNNLVHGAHPSWHMLTVDSSVPAGGFIGELKGHIGRKEDYYNDPSSRWTTLRHPEPFVFFHPHLPIFIDAKSEGNLFRYIRRSCSPNLGMTVFITNKTQYHFCFLATTDINAGDEITIPWDLDERVKRLLATVRNESKAAHDEIANWVGGVLGNFGGCACASTQSCALGHFDRRNGHHLPNPATQTYTASQAKSTKSSRKTKKANSTRTPPGTGNSNSRAGSEVQNRPDAEYDDDSRSISGSSRSKPASRDLTPMTHASVDANGLGVVLSDREKRKLLQTEKLFQQIEHEDPTQKRRKRNSGGSTLNTPSIGSMKQLSRPDGTNGHANNLSSPSSNGARFVRQHSLEYHESAVQAEIHFTPVAIRLPIRRKPRLSRAQRLFRSRCQSRIAQASAEQVAAVDKMDVDKTDTGPSKTTPAAEATSSSAAAEAAPTKVEGTLQSASVLATPEVEMEDVPDAGPPAADPKEMPSSAAPEVPTKQEPQDTPSKPAAPIVSALKSSTPSSNPTPRPSRLHVQLPPAPVLSPPLPTHTSDSPSSTMTADGRQPSPAVDGGMVQSPAPLNPIVNAPGIPPSAPSPVLASPITPSPMKKKMSLSQWSSRSKAKKTEALAAAAAATASKSATSADENNNVTSNPAPAASDVMLEPSATTTAAATTAPSTEIKVEGGKAEESKQAGDS